jgi:hypothetical protein
MAQEKRARRVFCRPTLHVGIKLRMMSGVHTEPRRHTNAWSSDTDTAGHDAGKVPAVPNVRRYLPPPKRV